MTSEKKLSAAIRSRRALLIGTAISEGQSAEIARKSADFTIRHWLRDRVKSTHRDTPMLRRWCIKNIKGF